MEAQQTSFLWDAKCGEVQSNPTILVTCLWENARLLEGLSQVQFGGAGLCNVLGAEACNSRSQQQEV